MSSTSGVASQVEFPSCGRNAPGSCETTDNRESSLFLEGVITSALSGKSGYNMIPK